MARRGWTGGDRYSHRDRDRCQARVEERGRRQQRRKTRQVRILQRGIDDRQGRPRKRGSSLLRTAANSPAGFVVGYQVKLSRSPSKCSKTSPQRNLLFGGSTGTGCVSRVGFGSGGSSNAAATAATATVWAGCLELHTAAIQGPFLDLVTAVGYETLSGPSPARAAGICPSQRRSASGNA